MTTTTTAPPARPAGTTTVPTRAAGTSAPATTGTATRAARRPVGQLLRHWRELRRLSQLELAGQADVSARHLSFVETGRSAPSRDMVLRLAEHLELPLRERNELLLAAGFAPVYQETAFEAPQMSLVRGTLRQMLAAHDPFPAIVVDRDWNLVEANASLALFTDGIPEALLRPPVNALRLALHPQGMARRIVNLGEWRARMLVRLRRRITTLGHDGLLGLYNELNAYPCDQPEPDLTAPGAADLVVPLRLHDERRGELSFFCTIATFGAPQDVTLAELAIESFFPGDDRTAAAVRANPAA